MADQTVPMISPDGKDVADVPADQVEHFKSLGAKVVEPPPPPTVMQQLGRGALNTLPAIGGMVGGMLSTPETLGAGTIPGIALGAGAGRGLRDVIGHFTGLDAPTSPLEKAGNIAGDTLLAGGTAAILPGVAEAAKAPIQTLREGAEQFGRGMPPAIRRLANILPSAPKAAAPLLERPPWQTWPQAPAPAAGALSAADKAMLVRQGYAPELIQKVEESAIAARAAKAPPTAGPTRPPIAVSPSSPMQPPAPSAADVVNGASQAQAARPENQAFIQQLRDSLAARTPAPSGSTSPLPVYPSAGTVKGVTSNQLEAASNAALAAGHWDEAERLIGQSLHAFFQGSGGPMAGVLAAAIAHKARQVVEPLRADPAFQQAPPQKQQQMIQQALRQPGARGALTQALGAQLETSGR